MALLLTMSLGFLTGCSGSVESDPFHRYSRGISSGGWELEDLPLNGYYTPSRFSASLMEGKAMRSGFFYWGDERAKFTKAYGYREDDLSWAILPNLYERDVVCNRKTHREEYLQRVRQEGFDPEALYRRFFSLIPDNTAMSVYLPIGARRIALIYRSESGEQMQDLSASARVTCADWLAYLASRRPIEPGRESNWRRKIPEECIEEPGTSLFISEENIPKVTRVLPDLTQSDIRRLFFGRVCDDGVEKESFISAKIQTGILGSYATPILMGSILLSLPRTVVEGLDMKSGSLYLELSLASGEIVQTKLPMEVDPVYESREK